MSSIKHSKFKNTGILFELLVRQLTADVLSNTQSKAQDIIKEHFSKRSELLKELELYNNLSKEKFTNEIKANHFIDAVLSARTRLNNGKLKREKYNLIKTIKESFDIDLFFKSSVENYKVLASIYKIFEEYTSNHDNSPLDSVKSRYTLVEHVSNAQSKDKKETNIYKEFKSQDKDVRITAYKILVERFNDKYRGLNLDQKRILSEYINHISNSPKLNDFIKSEIKNLKNILKENISIIKDKTVKIKLVEVSNILTTVYNKSKIEDNDVLAIMRYYELTEELANVK